MICCLNEHHLPIAYSNWCLDHPKVGISKGWLNKFFPITPFYGIDNLYTFANSDCFMAAFCREGLGPSDIDERDKQYGQ
ncbi:MAG TPA: hypothetical protein DCX14_00025 [Flavobacteriales bacterium]|nr:hypothetical protein [Flavobacteriales bacterium]